MITLTLNAILARRRTQPHGHYGKPPKRLLILTSTVAQGLTFYQRVFSSTARMNCLSYFAIGFAYLEYWSVAYELACPLDRADIQTRCGLLAQELSRGASYCAAFESHREIGTFAYDASHLFVETLWR